ncbi:MAG: RNA polymerase sigma factor [Planctomycetes bacterium]|nr:RNA polymerase sigma factor [Planctomycetota bacterium]
MMAATEKEQEDRAIRACQEGQAAAFEVLVRAHFGPAYAAAVGFLGNREDALDALQEAFTKAYRAIARFHADCDFYPWFYRILRNKCLDRLRRKRRRPRSVSIDDVQPAAEGPFDPSQLAEASERKAAVWRAIGTLSPDHREIILLRHFQGLAYADIARTLGIPQGTVMSRLYAARQALRRKLEITLGRDGTASPGAQDQERLNPAMGGEAIP